MKSVAVWVTAVLRRSSRMPTSRRAAHAMAGSVHSNCTGSKSSRDTAFLFFLSCGSTSAQQSMVGHILLFCRSPDNVLLRSFSVELVLRLGLNSHSLHLEGFPSTAQFAFRLLPAIRTRDDSRVCSAMSSLFDFCLWHLVLGLGGGHQIFS